MTSLNDVAYDVAVAIGANVDDARVYTAIQYNVKIAADKIRDKVVSGSLKSGDYRAYQDMLRVFSDVAILDFDPTTDYRYFLLPAETYSLPMDSGLNFVRYQQGHFPPNCPNDIARRNFATTTLAGVNTLYGAKYQAPSSIRPYIARYLGSDGTERVAVIGVDTLVKKLRVGLIAALPDLADIDPDEDLRLPPEDIYNLKKMVLALEGWVFQIPEQERLKNDGRAINLGQPPVRVAPVAETQTPDV